MKAARTIIGISVLLLVMGIATLWWSRISIATRVVDRKLSVVGVPARYRITRIGPFLERMEDVRIGDPARPDLIARRIDVSLGWGLTGPTVTAVTVDGARLNARLDGGGLHLGALDRLMPRSPGGVTVLPDLGVTLTDGRLGLATPNGFFDVRLTGHGNLARHFRGKATVDAGAVRLASCSLGRVEARLSVAIEAGTPRVAGPIAIGSTACPALRLGPGRAQVAASSDPAFSHVALQARLDGFGGAAGPVRLSAVHGLVKTSGKLGRLGVEGQFTVDHLAMPSAAAAVARYAALPRGLPVTPVADRARGAIARLIGDATGAARIEADIAGEQIAVRVREASLTGAGGVRLSAIARGGLLWSRAEWRTDGDFTLGGSDAPTIGLRVRQTAAGAPVTVTGALRPYRAGNASLAIPSIAIRWDGGDTRFALRALVDGPLGDGFVAGVDLPLAGVVTAGGTLSIGTGCQMVGFRALRLAGFRFDPARTRLCGHPIVARSAGGPVRIAAQIDPLRLSGRSGSGVPVTIAIGGGRVSEQGFAAEAVDATIGDSRLRLATLTGSLGSAWRGHYAGAEGAIAHVPLLLSDGEGVWRHAGGALALSGKLRIADQAASPRFLPLISDDMRLALDDGVIDATATLREPATGSEIVAVALRHSLADGAGGATLTARAVSFAPKRLQPEMLTPVTLGVVANVAGTISGEGRIDWSPTGVTSNGTFGTDRLDLAAAFGPVSGLKGRIRFTDLLALVSAPHQEVTIAEANPGVAVTEGVVRFQLLPANRIAIEDATWPFAGGSLRLDPTTLDMGQAAERRLTFRIEALDAAAFVQQLDFPNLAVKGTFDGLLPMIFDSRGGRIDNGYLAARPGGGTIAYIGELSRAQLGTMGKLAFDALKAIRYSALELRVDGRLDGEMISRVNFNGVREATPEQSLITRLIRNLPFRFNIRIRAPFRGLLGSARGYMDPRLLLTQHATAPMADVQPPASAPVR